MRTWDVIICGGGIIGMSLAIELRERGARILVLDRGEPGAEASAAAAGMLAALDPETPELLQPLCRASARIYPDFVGKLEKHSGVKVDFRRLGAIVFINHAALPADFKQLSSQQLHELEPEIRMNEDKVFFAAEDSLDPRLLMQAVIGAAGEIGVEIRGHTPVLQLRSLGSQIEVSVASERLCARAAVNCQGAWAGVPVRPRKGQLFYLQPRQADLLRHVVRAPEVYLVPRSSGKILVGSTVEDVGYDKRVEAETIARLHQAAIQLFPSLTTALVAESWAGLRPGSPDDLPLLGETDSRGIFLAAGHFRNGILLAPATARVMANMVEGKAPEWDVAAFSPQRFLAANAS